MNYYTVCVKPGTDTVQFELRTWNLRGRKCDKTNIAQKKDINLFYDRLIDQQTPLFVYEISMICVVLK